MKSVKLMGAALAACALMAGTAFAAPREGTRGIPIDIARKATIKV